jgi:sugar phosphate isomerase/epimerase
MQRISISELSSLRWSFFQDVVRYAAHGFDSIGIWRQKIDELDILEVTDFLFEMQTSVSSVHWAGGFTGGEGNSYVEAIADAIEAIQLSSRLNAEYLIVHPGCRNGHTLRHANRLFGGALKSLVPIANDYGVKLAIEPMPCPSASAWTFFESLESSLSLLNDFSAEDVGLVLDLYHVGLNTDVLEGLGKIVNQIALVQLADRESAFSPIEKRMLLGTGSVPFEKWLLRLQDLGYSGVYEIELHGPGMENTPYGVMLDSSAEFLQRESIDSLLTPSSDSARIGRSSPN